MNCAFFRTLYLATTWHLYNTLYNWYKKLNTKWEVSLINRVLTGWGDYTPVCVGPVVCEGRTPTFGTLKAVFKTTVASNIPQRWLKNRYGSIYEFTGTCFCLLLGGSVGPRDTDDAFIFLDVDIACVLLCFPILDSVTSLPRTGVFLSLPVILWRLLTGDL